MKIKIRFDAHNLEEGKKCIGCGKPAKHAVFVEGLEEETSNYWCGTFGCSKHAESQAINTARNLEKLKNS